MQQEDRGDRSKRRPRTGKEIIHWGQILIKADGDYTGREGGHSVNRVLHHKDITGKEIEKTLLEEVHGLENVTLLQHHFVLDLITQHHQGRIVTRHTPDITCYGAYLLNKENGDIERSWLVSP